MFQQITILGPGLLGASIALAAKERSLCRRVHAWSRRKTTRDKAIQTNWCDAVFDGAADACADSDLVVIATPVETIASLLEEIAPHLDRSTLVTDVGSTKRLICQEAQKIDAAFIGSHPMAGSERTSMKFARADLFEDAACILTPDGFSAQGDLERLRAFWEALGMRVTQCTPEEHDQIVAHISHLPHLLASSLCSYLEEKDHAWTLLAGGGLRDTTRVASGDPTLWQQILGQNRDEVLSALEGFQNELDAVKDALQTSDSAKLTAQLDQGKRFRDTLAMNLNPEDSP